MKKFHPIVESNIDVPNSKKQEQVKTTLNNWELILAPEIIQFSVNESQLKDIKLFLTYLNTGGRCY